MATSIDGEDELVDVTMKDSTGTRDSAENDAEATKSSESAKTS